MYLDPRHLLQLSVIVDAGSFQAAADQLGMAQPVLSRNMKALEGRLRAPLFRKVGRRSVPTALARQLARNGLSIRLAGEQAASFASKAAVGAVGELRIGAVPILSGQFLALTLAEFAVDNPECAIELRVGVVQELRSMLERDQIDLVIGPKGLCEGVDTLEYRHLADDRVGILCRAGHALTGSGPPSLDALRQSVWLMHSRGSLLRRQTEEALRAMGIEDLHIGFETDSVVSVFEIVAATDFVSTMPMVSTAAHLGDRLVFLPVDHQLFDRPIGAIRRKDRTENTAASGLIDRLSRNLRKMSRSSDLPVR